MINRDFMEKKDYEIYKNGEPLSPESEIIFSTMYNPSKHKRTYVYSQQSQQKFKIGIILIVVVAILLYFYYMYKTPYVAQTTINDISYEFAFSFNGTSDMIVFLLYIDNLSYEEKDLNVLQSLEFYTAKPANNHLFSKKYVLPEKEILKPRKNTSYYYSEDINKLEGFKFIGANIKVKNEIGEIINMDLVYPSNKAKITDRPDCVEQKYNGISYSFNYKYDPLTGLTKFRLSIKNLLNDTRDIIPTSYLNFFTSKKVINTAEYMTSYSVQIPFEDQIILEEGDERTYIITRNIDELGDFDAVGFACSIKGKDAKLLPEKKIILNYFITPKKIIN